MTPLQFPTILFDRIAADYFSLKISVYFALEIHEPVPCHLYRYTSVPLCLFTATFSGAIFTDKVGQADLILSTRSGFISMSVNARLQVSVCTAVTICSTLVNNLKPSVVMWLHFECLVP